MDTKNKHSIDADLFSAMTHVEEQKEALWTAWMDGTHQDAERVIRLAIEEVESVKNQHPDLNCSVPYQLGRLDGYTEFLEQLLRAEKRMNMIKEDLVRHSPKARQVLMCLDQNGDMRHGELAAAIGSSYSSLTNIMKKVLLSGAVESTRSGKNTYYHLTDSGRQYCESQSHSRNEWLAFIQAAIQESVNKAIQSQGGDKLPTQQINVAEKFVPIVNNEVYDPVRVDGIMTMGNLKYVVLNRAVANIEENKPDIIDISIAPMMTGRK